MGFTIFELDAIPHENHRLPVTVHPANHALDGPEHYGQLRDDQIPLFVMRDNEHQNDPHTMIISGRDVSVDGAKLDTIQFGAQVNNLTDQQAQSLTSGTHSSWHTHDEYYYKKSDLFLPNQSQINWMNLVNIPVAFPPLEHFHDNRYYTKTDLDTLVTKYYTKLELDAGQLDNRYFTESEIQSNYYTKTDLNSGQLDNRYYTEIELDSRFALYYTSAQLNTGQLDDRYFTETEINTLIDKYYTKVQLDGGQLDNRYYTETEIDQLITATSYGIKGSVDFYSQLPTLQSNERVIYISRHDEGTNKEGFYQWNGTAWVFLANNTGTSVHNQMLGLNDGDYKHLTVLQYTGLTAGQDTILHNHDNRYYTEAEIQTNYYSKAALDAGQLDNRYYTKTLVGTIFYTKTQLDGGQLDTRYFTETEITTNYYSKSQLDAGQLDTRYFTETEINTLIAKYYTKNELNAGQLDTRYYTEAEVDALISSSAYGVRGAVDTYSQLPTNHEVGVIYIVRQTAGSNQEGFYQWDGNVWLFLANNTGTSTHNDLTGLNNGDYLHLTSAQYIGLTAGNNTHLHLHDDRYYTETEIDTLISNYYTKTQLNNGQLDNRYYTEIEVNSFLSTKSDVGHTHDDRYYTEMEMNALLSTKSDTTHLHDDRYYTETEINTLISNYYNKTQIDTNLYTKVQLQTGGQAQVNWANLTSVPTTFTPSVHSHDDRYYTENEINAILTFYYTKTATDTIFSDYYLKTQSDARFAAIVHSHDDRYYLKTETDAKYSLLAHTHTKANITDFIESAYVHIIGNETITGNKTFSGSTTFSGNVTIAGTLTTVNSQTINLADNIITLNSDYTGSNPTENSGLEVKRGTQTNASIIWDETTDKWKAGLTGSEVEISLLGHTHDDRYYTENEIDIKLDALSAVVHNHDDLYYTEVELNAGQLDTRYYTESEVDTKITNIKTAGVKAVVDQYADLLSITDEVPGTVYIVREKNGVISGTPQLYTNTANTLIHMRFDGNTNDDMGHTNTGGGTITYEPGKVAQAGVFNNAYRTFANAADLNVTNQFSAGVWLYPTQLDPAKSYSLFDKYPTNNSQSGWGLIIEDGGKMHIWAMGPNQPLVKVVTYSKLRINQWTHIGLSFDGTMIKLWKDAVIVAELPFDGDIGANAAPIDIGRYYTDYFYAKLDDLFLTKDLFLANDFMRIVNGGAFTDYNSEGFWMWNGTSWTFLVQNMSGIYHNEMLGINREEFMHLTKNEYRLLTQSQDASSIHTHDGRYYTESEVDTKLSLKADTTHNHDSSYYTKTQLQTSGQSVVDWGNLANKPTTFPVATHTHDDRYYTETEMDTLLANKAPLSHNHDDMYFTELEITSNYYSKTQLNTGQLDTRYYTITQTDALLANKSATTHIHDDRYYTESEMNALLLNKSDITHTHTTFYTKAENDALLAGKAAAVHNHDTLYFTQTQLASSSGTSGASRIGVSLIGGMTATNVQSALQELKTSIAATSTTLNQAYIAGKTITATAGVVKIDSTGATNAPLEITNLTTAPTTGLTGGQMAVINNEFYIYNLAKNKWLTPTKTLSFGRTGSADGHVLTSTGTVRDDDSGYRMAKAGAIVSVTLNSVAVVSGKEVYIRINGTTAYTLTTNANGDILDTNINLNFAANDLISAYVSATGNPLKEVTMVFEYGWRV